MLSLKFGNSTSGFWAEYAIDIAPVQPCSLQLLLHLFLLAS
jgi:hypothetical protein